MGYTKEDLQTDDNWLHGLGACTEETRGFIIGLISNGFEMTKKEYVDFIKSVGKID